MPGFYDNAHLQFCSQKFSICRLNLVEREHIPKKVWCSKCFTSTDSSDEESAFDGL